jgi:hypothetical protein
MEVTAAPGHLGTRGYPSHQYRTLTPSSLSMSRGIPPSTPSARPCFLWTSGGKHRFGTLKPKGGGPPCYTMRHPPPPYHRFLRPGGVPPPPSVKGGTTPPAFQHRDLLFAWSLCRKRGDPPPYPEGGGGRPIIRWVGVPPGPYGSEGAPTPFPNVGYSPPLSVKGGGHPLTCGWAGPVRPRRWEGREQ